MNHIELKFNAVTSNIAFARTAVCAFVAPLNPTLEEIAELTGFCDAYYMTRQFKKIMGTTPGKYRRNS